MNRRSLIIAGVAATAGAGALWWSRPRDAAPGAEAGSTALAANQTGGRATAARLAASGPEADFWHLRYARPEGGELAMADLRGKPLVVNFWATWCPPCVKELPEIDRFARTFAARGWQVVGLAVDGAAPVREFLKKTPVSYPIGLAGFSATEVARQLGNTGGGLPFTVLFDASGKPVQRKLGQTHFDELAGWAAAA